MPIVNKNKRGSKEGAANAARRRAAAKRRALHSSKLPQMSNNPKGTFSTTSEAVKKRRERYQNI